jgi:multidrug efflux pump subunit AcrB
MIRRAVDLPYIVIVAVLVVAVLGIVSYRQLPADLLPTFTTPAVQIVTFYPGMPPEVMERDITSRLERWTGQSVGISHQEAKSLLGVSIVKDFFREGISFDTAMSQVTSFAMSDLFYLPPGTIPPMVMPFDPTASVPLALVAVSSETMNEQELYDVAYFELRNRLQSIEGVIAPAVYGGKLRRILAYVDREKLAARHLSPTDVVKALHQQSVFVPAGNMKAGDTDYQIFANAMPKEVAELNDVPVAANNGSLVFMRDVASVQDSAQIQTNVVRVNGRRQVYIPIYRQPGANTIEIVDGIRGQLTRIRDRLREMDARAKDIALEVVLDQSVYVRESIAALRTEGLLGALLAGLVILIFLRSFRTTVIAVIAIPLAVLATMIGLLASGQTINAMTLGGLALAIGILVDQAIVCVENIVRHREMGESAYDAAIGGAREVAAPIVVSCLSFAAVFLPIVFLSGMAKFLFAPLALAAVFAIFASLFVALFVVPAFSARLLQGGRERGHEGPGRIVPGYERLVRRAIAARWLVVLASVAGVAGAGMLLANLGQELFPRIDAGQFQIYVRMPSGTRIERTEETIARIERAVIEDLGEPDPEYPDNEKHPDSHLRMIISNIGVLMDWPAAYTPNTGPGDAFILVQLKHEAGTPSVFPLVERLRRRFHAEFPEAEFAFDTGGLLTAALNYGEPAPIHYQVSGSNLHTLEEIGGTIVTAIAGVEDVRDVRLMQRNDYPTIEIDIDRTKAALAGISVENIMHNLVTATNSSINYKPAFWIDESNGNHYFIGAQYRESDHVSIDTLLDIPVTSAAGGSPVPLRTLVRVRRGVGPSYVAHKDITRVVDIYADAAPGVPVGDVVAAIEGRLRDLEQLQLTPTEGRAGETVHAIGGDYAGRGYLLSASGEVHTMRSAFAQFGSGFFMAVVLIYLLMVAQFRSFVDPLLILATVVLGFIGVAVILSGTSTSLNIQSLMGTLMMMGIVVQYGVVLIDFANRRLAAGASVHEAIVDAARVRLRPIVMTTLVAALAVMPMAMGLGGSEADTALARAMVGGVLGAGFLTLFVVPSLYVLVKRSRARRGESLTGAMIHA